jgi:hypothetical protein
MYRYLLYIAFSVPIIWRRNLVSECSPRYLDIVHYKLAFVYNAQGLYYRRKVYRYRNLAACANMLAFGDRDGTQHGSKP